MRAVRSIPKTAEYICAIEFFLLIPKDKEILVRNHVHMRYFHGIDLDEIFIFPLINLVKQVQYCCLQNNFSAYFFGCAKGMINAAMSGDLANDIDTPSPLQTPSFLTMPISLLKPETSNDIYS